MSSVSELIGVKADAYNEENKFQTEDANNLLNLIVEQNKDIKYDIVVDIGCGSGNTTLLLRTFLNVNRIVAIDIAEDMIDFAKTNHQKKNIDYMVQDISVDWDQLRPELRQLEAKVSLVFSNQVLHWIEKKDNAVNNIKRLLSTRGQVYANIFFITDPFRNSTPEEKAMSAEFVMKVPTKEQQLNVWINHFNGADLKIIDINMVDGKSQFSESSFHKTLIPMGISLRRLYTVSTDEAERNEIIEKYFDNISKAIIDSTPTKTDALGVKYYMYSYLYFRFILQK